MASHRGHAKAEREKHVLLPVAHGSEEAEVVIVADVLRRAGARVTLASAESELRVTTSHRVTLVADKLLQDCIHGKFHLIVLPGGMQGAKKLRDTRALKTLVEAHAAAGREVAALCASPAVVLSSWGLLQHKRATAHLCVVDRLQDTSAAASRVVEDGNFTTSQGPGTAFDFSLKLVERLYGAKKAAAVASELLLAPDSSEGNWRLVLGPDVEPRARADVLVPIATGVEESEAVVVIDVLRRGGARVIVASVEETLEVVTMHGVRIVADVGITEAAQDSYDLIVLPGGIPGAERLRDSTALDALLRAQSAAARPLAAICASPVVSLLAKGLLQGKKATAYPGFATELPDQEAARAKVVRDGAVVTSQGPGTAFEFSLSLLELLFGPEKRSGVASALVVASPAAISAG